MRSLSTLIMVCLLQWPLWSQTDTPQVISLQMDTTWNHSILESDLILEVEVYDRVYVTGAGSFMCNILRVIKGTFNGDQLAFSIGLMEWSGLRWERRFGGISPPFDDTKLPYKAYVGFVKNNQYYDPITDPKTKQKYNFFMSEKELTNELKYYLLKSFYPHRKVIRLVMGV